MNHYKKTLLKQTKNNGDIKIEIGKDYLVKSFVAFNTWFVAKCVDIDSTKAYFEPTELVKKQLSHLAKKNNNVFSRDLFTINLNVKQFK